MVLPPRKVEKCCHRRPFTWPIIRIIKTMPMRQPVVVVGLVEGVSAEVVREGRRWQEYCIGLGQEAVPEEEKEEEEGVCRGLVGMACR